MQKVIVQISKLVNVFMECHIILLVFGLFFLTFDSIAGVIFKGMMFTVLGS